MKHYVLLLFYQNCLSRYFKSHTCCLCNHTENFIQRLIAAGNTGKRMIMKLCGFENESDIIPTRQLPHDICQRHPFIFKYAVYPRSIKRNIYLPRIQLLRPAGPVLNGHLHSHAGIPQLPAPRLSVPAVLPDRYSD